MTNQLKLVDGHLSLTLDPKIPKHISIQLRYFGFRFLDNKFISEINDQNPQEIIDFFNVNKINLVIAKDVNDLVQRKNKQKNDFEVKIKDLTELKKTKNFDNFKNEINFLKLLPRKLKYHQIESFLHLFEAKSSANFSVPGSGKTSVVLSFYEILKKRKLVDAVFVIGPKNCFGAWQSEFLETLGRESSSIFLSQSNKNRSSIYDDDVQSELYVCSFQTLTNDVKKKKIVNFFKRSRFLFVVDEAHNIKKIEGIWSKALLQVSKLSKYKVILTGTPRPNQHKDFYNYLDFLYPNQKILSSEEKATLEHMIREKRKDEASELLRKKIFPFFVRVTKKELGLSKPFFHKPIIIKMNHIEEKVYDAIITNIKYYSKRKFLENIDFISKLRKARIMRLRQTCSHVSNLTKISTLDILENEDVTNTPIIRELILEYQKNEVPAKYQTLERMILEFSKKKKKVLVWTNFILTASFIKKKLQEKQINVQKVSGETSIEKREEIKDEFNNPESQLQVIIANPKACSESMSLHKDCQNAIYYDLSYNAAEFLQSLDRIHRVGGSEKKPVNYYFLNYKNSVDEKIFTRVRQKADEQMQVIEKGNLLFSDSNEDEDYDELYKSMNL